jgi:Uri superfamily endonuclease
VLVIQIDKDVNLNVGALGKLKFAKGFYAYVGSAQANLEQRIKHHFRKEKRKFWHVDYLLDNDSAKITKVFSKKANKTEECKIAKVISERGGSIGGFGCSDCNCKSHLFQIRDYGFLQKLMQDFTIIT